ncbi:MAG: aminotransferase class IV [Bacteroidales bacterium]
MYRFLETIRIEDGQICNADLHQERMDRSRYELLGISDPLPLEKEITSEVEQLRGIWKCRLVYSCTTLEMSLTPYVPRRINSLRLITDNQIEYTYKWEDRSKLMQCFSLRGACDEIILVKNGFITDTSYSNLAFFDGKDWVTPANPLLNGVRRQALIRQRKIKTADIAPAELSKYKKLSLINAMLDLGEVEVPCTSVYT